MRKKRRGEKRRAASCGLYTRVVHDELLRVKKGITNPFLK
jgi:hypothetical protein